MNLYDLLDVDETATREEIRAAWKAATVDLDPTDRRFRAFNDAASVLLDEHKRTAYDAELAATRTAEEPAPAAEENALGEAAPEQTAPDEAAPDGASPADDEPDETSSADEAPGTAPVADEAPEEQAPDTDATRTSGPPAGEVAAQPETAGPPRWAFVAALAAAVVSLLLLVAVLVAPGTLGGEPPSERADAAGEAARSAEAAVADLVPVVLAYDYRTFDDDVDRARAYLTDEYAAERDELFESTVTVQDRELTFREQVVEEKLMVAAAVARTGLTRVSEDGEVAQVVAFIDQESRKGDAAPQPLKMWATLTLQREDGRWLLDDVCTESDCF